MKINLNGADHQMRRWRVSFLSALLDNFLVNCTINIFQTNTWCCYCCESLIVRFDYHIMRYTTHRAICVKKLSLQCRVLHLKKNNGSQPFFVAFESISSQGG